MPERHLLGVGASPGVAVGCPRVIRPLSGLASGVVAEEHREAERAQALEALRAASADLLEIGAKLRDRGRVAEAEIVEAGGLMAEDPVLRANVEAAVVERGLAAEVALVEAADRCAAEIARIDDAALAARADDVRSIGRRAARIASGETRAVAGGEELILVAQDLGPADIAELGRDVRAVALAAGAASAHAAIVARSLGVPMVVAAGEELLGVLAESPIVVDGDAGRVIVAPSRSTIETARRSARERAQARARAAAARELPSVTRDGHPVRILMNAASAAEVAAGLEAGADGAGLIRTELAFLDASAWPTEDEHLRALEPILAGLRGRTATVRVLDFGGDKTPPFLAGTDQRGLRLLLDRPDVFDAQLRAILRAAMGCQLRLLLPMVTGPVELVAARAALEQALAATPRAGSPQVGAMIELPRAAACADKLALHAEFLSIGTNDLTHAALGSDRFSAAESATYHPRVLALIERSVRAAKLAGVPIEVCGEAASDPLVLPLLVGLGVDELSVGAARVGITREWIRALDFGQARDLAQRALAAADAGEVATLVAPLARPLVLLEGGDATRQRLQSTDSVLAVGP